MRRYPLWLVVPLLGTAPAAAQQVLYTPVPPKGSAYIRFVNATDGAMKVTPDFLPPQRLGVGAADRVSAYAVVEHVAGRSMTLDIADGARHGHAAVTAAPGSFVTVILRGDGGSGIAAMPVVDQTDFNQTKSHLSFYNATIDCESADLKLKTNGAGVFTGVPPGAAKARSVNPVTATVVPNCAGAAGPPVALQGLEQGGMYSVWLMHPQPTQTVSFISRDTTLPWKP